MGGSSGGKGGKTEQKSETSQTNAPPAWARPLYEQGSKDALNLYNTGQGGNVYQGDRVTDLSDTTQNAISGMQGNANNYNNNYLNGLATGETSSSKNLGEMAAGGMVGNNPYFNQSLQNTLDNTANTINSRMSGAGRYGSGAHSGVMSNNLGQIATNAMSQQYNQDVQNQMNANQMIDNSNQNQLAGANSWYQGQGNALKNALLGGQILDQNSQDKLNANWQKWSETDNQGWNKLGLLQSAANGFSGNYGTQSGTQTQTQEQKGGSPLGGALGFAGGLLGKSDIRAKENIEKIGTKNGYPVYEFNYIGKPERWRGVMAQDVLEITPDAVSVDPADGLYQVDYSMLGFPMERV